MHDVMSVHTYALAHAQRSTRVHAYAHAHRWCAFITTSDVAGRPINRVCGAACGVKASSSSYQPLLWQRARAMTFRPADASRPGRPLAVRPQWQWSLHVRYVLLLHVFAYFVAVVRAPGEFAKCCTGRMHEGRTDFCVSRIIPLYLQRTRAPLALSHLLINSLRVLS